MGKKSITLAGLVRRVRKQLFDSSIPAGREDAIETIMDARPDWTYEEAERLYEWMDDKEMYTSNWIAVYFCERHRSLYRVCIDQHPKLQQTVVVPSVIAAAATATTSAPIAKKQEAKRQAEVAADVAVKKAEEEKHLPGKRPVLEAIFGRDWQRIVMEKAATREGQQWLNRKVEMWGGEQDRIAAYNYLNSMDSLALLHTDFPGVKK
jgi:hypothetical protein